ncbi:MAG: enoyl-CoA hydratase [Acetobacteraceae bacterium]|nr:enoyl-CoA hydratase [Acetobacteraceae bacterium]MCX7685471.1 enoyl-CoA hydratase [Acetobacteraceae bacterium]MDW8399258.1 enoyl-CoA hydratase [Acetobacteraceae bacterium]
MTLVHSLPAPGVALTRIDRAGARNAFTFAMYEDLAAAARRIGADPSVRAWVIAGREGEAFASGTDIAQFRGFGAEDGARYEALLERAIAAVESVEKPVLAAISGPCTGGGAVLAAVCDLRVGAADARIGIPIARTLGNCVSAANAARLAAVVGLSRAMELLLSARLLDAEEALAAGFLTTLVARDATAEALAQAARIAGFAPLTLAACKAALRRVEREGRAARDADLIARCYGSADFAEGVAAFLERRPPRWSGA